MVICTENDKDFYKYKDKVNNRKVVFSIKQIFKDWWNKFLDTFPNFNIRDVVFSNVERMLKCKTWDLGFAIFSCPNCGKENVAVKAHEPEVVGECPQCGKPLLKRSGRFGEFIGCKGFPKCKFTCSVDELESKLKN